jgi:hypothetical protein
MTKKVNACKPREQSAFLKRAYQTRVNDPSFLPNYKKYQFCILREYNRKIVASSIAKFMNIN